MKYVVAVVAAVLIFACSFLLAAVLLAWLVPGIALAPISLGAVGGNLGGLIAAVLASVAATASFKASLSRAAKTGRIFKKKKRR